MKLSQILLTIALLTSLSVIKSSHAGSATWNLNPTSGDWNTATNWTPETVPEEATDVATFDVSSVTNISTTSPGVAIGQITFNPGASAYLIAGKVGFETSGVVNNSGITQNFDISAGFSFAGTATAGSGVVYTHYGGVSSGDSTFFVDNSNAGTATFIINGYNTGFQSGGLVFFEDHSSAADSIIINEQGDFSGGQTYFNDSATAGNSTITTQTGGALVFDNHATGATATLMADGGSILFQALSTGSLAQVELISGGLLDLGRHTNSGLMTIGSLEGDNTSTVRLGTQKFTVGGNGLSTTFSGIITQGGSLVKTGNERLTLTGANTYSGGTIITGGTLLAQARTGSATGTGPVNVNAGTLGGRGTIAGAVTVGTGSGTGAFLAPGAKGPDTLATSRTLTFKADGSYKCQLSLAQAKADQVNAKGVTIESGAQFFLLSKGSQTLAPGTVFTVIGNAATTPISGSFANLADGSAVAAGPNNLQASYEGGDGNDLTLTVQ